MTTYDDANLEPSEVREPSLDELLGDVLGLIDQVVEARLADGELARRRARIKGDVDRGAPTPSASGCDGLVLPRLADLLAIVSATRDQWPQRLRVSLAAVRRRLIAAADRDAEEIRGTARQAAERYQGTAFKRAAETVAAARQEADHILGVARQEAEQITDAEVDRAADDGWRRAAAASAPSDGGTTRSGLPKRVQAAQPVPGGIDSQAAGVKARRTPDEVRGLLSAYHRGVQRSRTSDGSGPAQRSIDEERR